MKNNKQEWDTPVIQVDLDRLEQNLKAMADRARKANVVLRPHTKTHKSVTIAKQQTELGAGGITVAKLGEAEVMADAGMNDILIAYPIVGPAKIRRLLALSERVDVIVSCDDPEVASPLSDAFEAVGIRLPLYIDVNTGLNRCGREPGEATLEIIRTISQMPGVEIRGLMTHAGHVYSESDPEVVRQVAKHEAESLVYTKELAQKEGIEIPVVSVGSSPTAFFIGEQCGVDEMRPGSYVFGDRTLLSIGLMREEECALTILATVVSTPRPGVAIVDGGTKTFGNDAHPNWPGYGQVVGHPDWILQKLSEEHGMLQLPEGASVLIGDVLAFIPNHCCFTVNLHDQLTAVHGLEITEPIEIQGRGRIR